VRVIDLTRVLAGPFCAMSLGDMGAEVIKIEEPGKGDDTRGWPPFVSGEATYFLSVNRNKKSLTLNMKPPEGQEILRALIARADVVLENFRPGTMERLGFGYERLRRLNPRLVYCSISGFGESGPESHRPGYDLIVQGESGVMDLTGFPDGPPVKAGPTLVDFMGGIHLYAGIVTALYDRDRSGAGRLVEVAMQEAVWPTLAASYDYYYRTGEVPPRTGNRQSGLNSAPYNVYATADGHVAIHVVTEAHFQNLLKAMGREDLADDPRFVADYRWALDSLISRGARATLEDLDSRGS